MSRPLTTLAALFVLLYATMPAAATPVAPTGPPAARASPTASAEGRAPDAGPPSSAEPDGLPDGPPQPPPVAPAVRPVDGELVRPFEPPATPRGPGHRGVDLAAEPGDEVRALRAGVVAFAGVVAGVGWVSVDHADGVRTTYGPLDPRQVAAGERVRAGRVLGLLAAGADHLDLGARRGETYIDPLGLLGGWSARLTTPDRLVDPVAETLGAIAVGAGGPLVWPAPGRIGSGFGYRIHPISGRRKLHAGVDIGAPAGTPIVAAAAGRVLRSGVAGGYGNLVEIDHGGGVTTRYGHCSVLLVRAGQPVTAGQVVARVGSTGASTGPHLHFEVRVGGQPTDPLSHYPPAAGG